MSNPSCDIDSLAGPYLAPRGLSPQRTGQQLVKKFKELE